MKILGLFYTYTSNHLSFDLTVCVVREGAAKLRRGVAALFYLIRHQATQWIRRPPDVDVPSSCDEV